MILGLFLCVLYKPTMENHNSYFFQLLFVKFIAVSQIQFRDSFDSDKQI